MAAANDKIEQLKNSQKIAQISHHYTHRPRQKYGLPDMFEQRVVEARKIEKQKL